MNKISYELSKGIPNYFGQQRFGSNADNHVIGKMIVKREYENALELINKMYGSKFSSFQDFVFNDKKLAKFFIHSYQSWIFNECLNIYVAKNNNPLFDKIPLIGFDTGQNKINTILKSIMTKEKIKAADFCLKDIKIKCRGSERDAFIKVDVKFYQDNDKIVVNFSLPKGSYATNVIREISKNE